GIQILLLLDLAITIGAAAAWLVRPMWRRRIMAFWLIMLAFPGGGIVLALLLIPGSEPETADNANEADSIWLGLNQLPQMLDVNKETNIAPLQDMLLVADYDKRREVLLDIMKTDVMTYINYINSALQNEDLETVHYAATGLQHVRQKLDARMQEFSKRWQEDPTNTQLAADYADLLAQYLSSIPLDVITRQQYIHISIGILEQLVRQTDLTRISRLIDQLLSIGNYQQVKHYCRILQTDYPDSEKKYLVLLKSYFLMKDKEKFEQSFNRFRESDVRFSDETLNTIRLWLGAFR
ncbi:MAG: hypothetical protein GX749_07815, partial [Ruminococcaceae bacterium]|nr:hypothetical protein [Oscillospiraceae bacterium]